MIVTSMLFISRCPFKAVACWFCLVWSFEPSVRSLAFSCDGDDGNKEHIIEAEPKFVRIGLRLHACCIICSDFPSQSI